MESLGVEEKEAFCALLKAMLRYLPGERISVTEVLQSDWIQKWAIPELKNLHGRSEEENKARREEEEKAGQEEERKPRQEKEERERRQEEEKVRREEDDQGEVKLAKEKATSDDAKDG